MVKLLVAKGFKSQCIPKKLLMNRREIEDFQDRLVEQIRDSGIEPKVILLHPDTYWEMVQVSTIHTIEGRFDSTSIKDALGKKIRTSYDVERLQFEIY